MGGNYKVIFGQRSREDLKGIVPHVRQNSGVPELAARFGTALIQKALSLSRMAEGGRIVPEVGLPEVREIIFRDYRVVYRIAPGQVQVLRFWHAARGVPEISIDEFRKAHEVREPEQAFNCFTPRAQQVLALARREAERFRHNFVGTEHVLLGLIRLGQGVAVNVLWKLGLELESVRLEVEKQVGKGPDQQVSDKIPYTPRVKRVLALASKEAKVLNHTYVGTEHILVGLLRDGNEGVAGRVLKHFGVDIDATRQLVLKELDPNFGKT